MGLFRRSTKVARSETKKNHRARNIFLIIVVALIVFGIAFLWKAGSTVQKVSGGNIFENIVRSLPGVTNTLKGEDAGRINVVLLGMRGVGVDGGGLLADTIMVASIFPEQGAISLVSVPRDLYVTVPGTDWKSKINGVHAEGEKDGKGQGLEMMKQVLADVTGQEMHYAMRIDFAGFQELVDSLGGINIYLAEPFVEAKQFHQEQVCDPNVFTIPSGNTEKKISGRTGKIKAEYPLCYNANEECGGIFELPAGENQLDGEKALCYVRSRFSSTDFDRARRQQEVMKQIKSKALSVGTLTDFTKINGMINALGDNVKTDMAAWEIKAMWELQQEKLASPNIEQKVLEASDEGLLYHPENGEAGYILLPIGDTYDRIREMFRNMP